MEEKLRKEKVISKFIEEQRCSFCTCTAKSMTCCEVLCVQAEKEARKKHKEVIDMYLGEDNGEAEKDTERGKN